MSTLRLSRHWILVIALLIAVPVMAIAAAALAMNDQFMLALATFVNRPLTEGSIGDALLLYIVVRALSWRPGSDR